jgi:predicted ribosomally synthesized peptide with SipW-like signal peptide
MKVLCSSFVFVLGVCLLLSAPSYSYFTDTDMIEMNIATGTWAEQSTDVTFDISGALLTGHGSQGFHLHNIFLGNTGDVPVEITGVIVRWDPGDGEMLQQVHISGASGNGGDHFWTGMTGSGSFVEGEYVLSPSGPGNVHCWFDSDMSGKTISITFVFDDGSQKGVSVLI